MKKTIKKNQEIEYKWQANSVRDYHLFLELSQNLGAKLSKSQAVQVKDLYLDTLERFFQSSHLTCRIRLSNGCSELTLKSFSEPKQKIFIRDEKTIPLPQFTSHKAALTYCRNKLFKNIHPLFEILNNRQIHTLTLPCGTSAEASFDQVVMTYGKNKFRMREIELEFKSGDLKKFNAFAHQLSCLPLNPSKSSKYKEAMSHLTENSLSYSIDSITDLVNQILKINLQKLKEGKDDFLTNFNPEATHDMRVATRRLRTAIKTFKGILPDKAKKIRTDLNKLGRMLGKKRDLDVFSQFILNSLNNKSPSFQKLSRQNNKSLKLILSMFKSKYYENLIGSLEQLKTDTCKKNSLKVSRTRIQNELTNVLKIASSIDSDVDDQTLHNLRISMKKLRYVCEFFEPIFNKYICSLSSFIEKTKKIQDILGDHQDAIKGILMLTRYKSHFSLKEFLQIQIKYERKKSSTRLSFSKIWKDFWFGNGFRHSSPTSAIELILG